MPANVAPRSITEEFDVHQALKYGLLYRVKEFEHMNGDRVREITYNDGRYEGDKRGELAKLRQDLLDIDGDNSKLVLENTKLYNENTAKDQLIAQKDQIIEDLRREISYLQKDNSNLKDESQARIGRTQADTNELKSQLTQRSRDLQSQTDRNANLLTRIEQLTDQLKDTETIQKTITERESELTMMKNSYDSLLTAHGSLQKDLEDYQENLLLAQTSLSDRTTTLETLQKELARLQEDKSKSPEKNITLGKRLPTHMCSDKWWNGIPVENGKLILKGKVHPASICQADFSREHAYLISRRLTERGMVNLDPLNNFEHRDLKADIIKEFENRTVT